MLSTSSLPKHSKPAELGHAKPGGWQELNNRLHYHLVSSLEIESEAEQPGFKLAFRDRGAGIPSGISVCHSTCLRTLFPSLSLTKSLWEKVKIFKDLFYVDTSC